MRRATEADIRRGAEPLATFREALVRFRHVFKVYRVADTGVVALGEPATTLRILAAALIVAGIALMRFSTPA